MASLNERIMELEMQVLELTTKLQDLSANTEQKYKNPTSIVGGLRDRSTIHPVDFSTGKSQEFGGSIIWNDSELVLPPTNTEPATPVKGYNKHSHSRFSGGALIKDCIEIVEYVWDSITNKDCPQFWQSQPKIKTSINTNKQSVENIGLLDLIFNADTLKWGTTAYEIDIKKCFLVERDASGNIVVDGQGNEKKSPLYNADATKSAIVWDESVQCWRFYAVYASGE